MSWSSVSVALAVLVGGCGLTLGVDPVDVAPGRDGGMDSNLPDEDSGHHDGGEDTKRDEGVVDADPADGDVGPVECAAARNGARCGEGSMIPLVCLDGECVPSRCGDGYVDDRSEQCDDENAVSNDGCEPGSCVFSCVTSEEGNHCPDAADCARYECVDHVCRVELSAGECEGGTCNDAGVCIPRDCGDGAIDEGEDCDLGSRNYEDHSGCTPNCRYECDRERTGSCDDGDECNGEEVCEATDGGYACQTNGRTCPEPSIDDCYFSGCDTVINACIDERLVDEDGDGFAAGRCDRGNDCDPENPSIFPGAPTVPDDGIDQDCDDDFDESERAEHDWYRDADRDRYGDRRVVVRATEAPEGYVANDLDCYDGDRFAHPGQMSFFTVGYGDDESFDWDCRDGEMLELSQVAGDCALVGTSCRGRSGWVGFVPDCGISGAYQVCVGIDLGILGLLCSASTTTRVQACR